MSDDNLALSCQTCGRPTRRAHTKEECQANLDWFHENITMGADRVLTAISELRALDQHDKADRHQAALDKQLERVSLWRRAVRWISN